MEVVDFQFVFNHLVAEIIGGSISGPSTNSPTRHPHGKAEWVMVSSVGALREGCPPEFTGPENEGFIQ